MEELQQPRSFDDWRKAKHGHFEEVRALLPGSVDVAESVLSGFVDLQVAAQPVNPNDDRVLLVPMVLSSHRGLLNSMQLLLEGQFLEAFAIFRPTAELAGHALRMSRDAKLVRVWLNRDEKEGAFNKAFKPHLPQDDPLTKGLFDLWDMASDTGMHANGKLILFHFEAGKRELDMRYFPMEVPTLQRFFIYFISNAASILRIYAVGLGCYFGKDFLPVIKAALEKVQDHVRAYSSHVLAEARREAEEDDRSRSTAAGEGA